MHNLTKLLNKEGNSQDIESSLFGSILALVVKSYLFSSRVFLWNFSITSSDIPSTGQTTLKRSIFFLHTYFMCQLYSMSSESHINAKISSFSFSHLFHSKQYEELNSNHFYCFFFFFKWDFIMCNPGFLSYAS